MLTGSIFGGWYLPLGVEGVLLPLERLNKQNLLSPQTQLLG